MRARHIDSSEQLSSRKRVMRLQRFVSLLVLLLCCALTSTSNVAGQSHIKSDADALFQKKKWDQAVIAYGAIIKTAPRNGPAWYRLGRSLYELKKYGEAVEAFQHAAAIGHNPQVMFDLARGYAMLNNKDQAFDWLEKALNAGFYEVARIGTDDDLKSLRLDARFKKALSLGERLTKPCMFQPESRQFDFWVGEWDVINGGHHAGTNSVQRILDGCVLFENWSSDQGPPGKSFNVYDASMHRWQQTWIDSTGNVLNLFGLFKDNALRYMGESVDAKGNKILHKLTFFNLGHDRVRQLWEQSEDNGDTWSSVWDGLYVRRQRAKRHPRRLVVQPGHPNVLTPHIE